MKYIIKALIAFTVVLALVLPSLSAQADDSVEVLHWWTSGGEAAALGVLKRDLETQGVTWNDVPVAGGGGEAAMTALRARVTAGNPPTAMQVLGFDIQDWAAEGVLADLNALAARENWDTVVPNALQRFSKYDGKWVAAPVNVHSTNWVWGSSKVLKKIGVNSIPKTWDEFIAIARKAQKAGYIGLAHGGQAWQEATMFDGVVLATGGVDFYRDALVNLNPEALKSDTMVEVFARMSQLRSLVDKNFSGRDWNLATALVIQNKAAFQIMGDWAKGEFLNAKRVPHKDFLCFRVPDTENAVSFNSDQFAMFDVAADKQAAQSKLAKSIMDPAFQSAFNQVKGSVPARVDVSNKGFDQCGQLAMADLSRANKNGTLVGSLAHGHAAPAAVKNAFYDVITAQFNGEYSPREAAEELVDAVQAAQ